MRRICIVAITRRCLPLFVSLIQVQGKVRSGTNVPIMKFPRSEAAPHSFKYPPTTKPNFMFFGASAHYPYKNKISQNAGYTNVRDGMYFTDLWLLGKHVGLFAEVTSDDIVTNRDYNALDFAYFCPPRKLGDLRYKILAHYSWPGLVGGGKCTLWSFTMNLVRARLLATFQSTDNPVDVLVGSPSAYLTSKTTWHRTRKWGKMMFVQTSYYEDIVIARQMHRNRPFSLITARGRWRGGAEFAAKRRSFFTRWLTPVLMFLSNCFMFWNFLLAIQYGPMLFATLGSKTTKMKDDWKVQQVVCPMEGIANAGRILSTYTCSFYGGMVKYNSFTPLTLSITFWQFEYSTWATYTTLILALNWNNESAAAKKMSKAAPVFQVYKKEISVAVVFLLVVESQMWLAYVLWMGPWTRLFNGYLILFLIYPTMCFAMAMIFQREAGKVVDNLAAGGSTNAALVAFRKKMITNLARGGLSDIAGYFFVLFSAGLPGNHANVAFSSTIRVTFKTLVSHFQLIAIEPPQAAAARKKARSKAKNISSGMRSSFSSVSSSADSSSMSSSTSSASTSDSSSSSTSSTSSTEAATTVS